MQYTALLIGAIALIVPSAIGYSNAFAESFYIDETPVEKIYEFSDAAKEKIYLFSPAKGHTNIVTFHSDTDMNRLQQFQKALLSNKPYLWATHGGYGSARIVELLDMAQPPKQNKIIIGYSDVTALHLAVDRWGWQSIHGAMEFELARPKKNIINLQSLEAIIAGEKESLIYNNIVPLNEAAQKELHLDTKIIGGDLSVISTSIGTKWQIQPKGRTLFFEDINETGSSIDRLLMHIKQAGIIDESQAVLFGTFGDDCALCHYSIQRFAQSTNKPVFSSNFFGHSHTNLPLPLNTDTIIKCRDNNKCMMKSSIPSYKDKN